MNCGDDPAAQTITAGMAELFSGGVMNDWRARARAIDVVRSGKGGRLTVATRQAQRVEPPLRT